MTDLRITTTRIDRAGPGAAATYRALFSARVSELLGRWASGLDPEIRQQVDVSPQVLARIGIAAAGHPLPTFIVEVTVSDMIAAGALDS